MLRNISVYNNKSRKVEKIRFLGTKQSTNRVVIKNVKVEIT